MSDQQVPSILSVISTLFTVSWKRLLRGKALWVCALIAALPALIAFAARNSSDKWEGIAWATYRVMALLPPIFVASAIGEEIEDRTITYLWSRPIARWTLLVGKIAALAPVAMLLVVMSWTTASLVGGRQPEAQQLIAFAAGALAVSLVAAGIATLVPKQGMPLAIIYLVIVDATVAAIPASLRDITVTRQVQLLSGLEGHADLVKPAISLVVICAVWLAIGLARVRRLES